jgi:hypothetical protein
MVEIPVIKHWIITAFTPADTLDASIGGTPAVTAVVGGSGNALYPDSKSAMDDARQLAAFNPGTYYVVYEAMWWAHTDPVQVHLLPVNVVAV